MLYTFFKRYRNILTALLLSSVALYLRYQRFAHSTLGGDEAFQYRIALGDFKPVWKWNFYCDITCFPGDYLMTYPFIKLFGDNVWALRIPRIAITILGFYLVYIICRRYFRTTWGYIVTFMVVCFNSTLIGHSFELRPYSVLPTLALAALYFSDVLIEEKNKLNTLQRILIAIFFIILSGYHIYGAFIIFLPLLFSVLKALDKKSLKEVFREQFRYWAIVSFFTISIWVYYVIGTQVKFPTSPEMFAGSDLQTFAYIPNPLVDVVGFLKAIFGNLIGKKSLYFLLLGIGSLFLASNKDRFKQVGFFLILVILPTQLIFLGSVIKGYRFLQRQFIWVMPFFAIFLGWIWDSLAVYLSNYIRSKKK